MTHQVITKDELLGRYASGKRDFQGIELCDGTDLSDTNLDGCDFTGSFLTDISFNNSSIQNTKLNECNLKCSDFSRANLTGTSLRGSLIDAIDLEDTILEPEALIGAIFQSFTLDLEAAIKYISNHLKPAK